MWCTYPVILGAALVGALGGPHQGTHEGCPYGAVKESAPNTISDRRGTSFLVFLPRGRFMPVAEG